jgi:hypothetical protein
MNLITTHLTRLLLSSTLLLSTTALAEQMISDGRYEIHYNAFNSSFITPEVAQLNNITRSKYRALVNVSVLKFEEDGSKTPVTAIVNGQAANLLGQAQQMEFQKIDEGNALYYIGSFRFTEEERLKISLEVQPDPDESPYNIEFEQTFYAD